jgi:Pyruvate/2-oxoacid:ferredoxin oxidoreductase delta subunit
VVNIPKLKTHAQMLMTLGVKNLFGTVVSQRKAEWHAMIGVDRDAFASLLLDIYHTVAPVLTILDGVWGMEGRGPANGQPKFCGLIAASAEALALDMKICQVLGVPLKRFPLYRAAVARNDIPLDLAGIETIGDDLKQPAISDFKLPKLEALSVLPPFLTNLAGRYLVSKPYQRPGDCIACRKCTDICASKAIVLNEKRRLIFDYDRCIRCYCCQEVCPQDAIDFRPGPVVRILNLLGR